MAVELNSIGGVGCKSDFTGLGRESRDHVTNRPASLQLCNEQPAICGILPYPQFLARASQEFLTNVPIALFKGTIHFEEETFFESGIENVSIQHDRFRGVSHKTEYSSRG